MNAAVQLITVNVMARRLRVPVGWLREEAIAGRVPSLRAGRAILVNPEAVEAALVQRAIDIAVTTAADDERSL